MNNYFLETHHHEWILTNRKGAYALGTGNLINQRKYHGLLIASDAKFQRNHLVAGIEEKVEWRGEVIHLDSNNYSNCIYPEGFLYLVKPWLRPYPAFLYSALPHQNDILILKELMMDEKSNTVLVRYTNLGHHPLHFQLHPKLTMNPHHSLNTDGSLDFEEFDAEAFGSDEGCGFRAKRVQNNLEVYCHSQMGSAEPNRFVYYNVYYPWEVMAGYSGIGDQISLFELKFALKPGESNCVLFSDSPIEYPQAVKDAILKRYADLPLPADFPCCADEDDTLISNLDYNDNLLFKHDEYLQLLEFALKDFIANDDIVAGYPYYGAWGRDTMIVLNALLRIPGQLEQVEKVLRKYSRHLRGGLIPNMLPETGREVNYDSIDATLWYIILLWKVGKRKVDVGYWKEVIHLCEEILKSILNNKQYPFEIRQDGLINLKPEFAHATWMDVRMDGQSITPRDGAPVEINSLWYNALSCYEAMCKSYQEASGIPYLPMDLLVSTKEKVKEAFRKYWTSDYLADRLVGDTQIKEVRPNAILALSLPWQPVDKGQMKAVFLKAEAELLTPYGIRTLSPQDPRFRKKYYGSQKERDLAYHNGSVWAWLLGAFCGLGLKIWREDLDDEALAAKLSGYVQTFRTSFQKGHIASLAEVWDGDSPHFPKGAPAQAISVAALYNIETFIATLREES
ncbi:MAG: glycogen debranching enzyme N-terminal domain-containing protein [Candidatus Cloacimonetes bacterium]|nr:glycogen debranching enzyme N-terminal domain-containing protein [Candidatus Cloacimonadota bacterium]